MMIKLMGSLIVMLSFVACAPKQEIVLKPTADSLSVLEGEKDRVRGEMDRLFKQNRTPDDNLYRKALENEIN